MSRRRRPLRVRWEGLRRQWRQMLSIGLLFLLVAVSLYLVRLGMQYVLPVEAPGPVVCRGAPGLTVSLVYPTYLALGDEGFLDVTVHNTATHTVTGTLVVAFTGPVPVRLAAGTDSAIRLEGLAPGASHTQRLRFFRSEPVSSASLLGSPGLPVRFTLSWAGSPVPCADRAWELRPAPVYRLQAVLRWLGGLLAAGAAGLLKDLWDLLKHRLTAKP